MPADRVPGQRADDDDDRVQPDARAHDPGQQVEVLDLLDQEVDEPDQDRKPGVRQGKPARAEHERDEHAGHRREHRPDRRDELEHGGDEAEHRRVADAEDGHREPHDQAHGQRQQQLAPDERIPDERQLAPEPAELGAPIVGHPLRDEPAKALAIARDVERHDQDEEEPDDPAERALAARS